MWLAAVFLCTSAGSPFGRLVQYRESPTGIIEPRSSEVSFAMVGAMGETDVLTALLETQDPRFADVRREAFFRRIIPVPPAAQIRLEDALELVRRSLALTFQHQTRSMVGPTSNVALVALDGSFRWLDS